MITIASFLLAFIMMLVLPETALVSAVRTQSCSKSPNLSGYTSIADMNSDMQDELNAIRTAGGGAASSYYFYYLCPETTFDVTATGPLRPVLSGLYVVCGSTGRQDDRCVFSGGADQVVLEDSVVGGYAFETITIQGVTFEKFTHAAVSGGAASRVQLRLFSTVFRDFTSMFVVAQQGNNNNADASPPFGVDLTAGRVVDGTATEAVFTNDGGDLSIFELTATNLGLSSDETTTVSLVSTTDQGRSDLAAIDVHDSRIENVFYVSGKSSVKIGQTVIHDMKGMMSAFAVTGKDTSLTVSETFVRDNNGNNKKRWVGANVTSGGHAAFTGSTFLSNSGTQYLFSSVNGASVILDRISIIDSVGGLGVEPFEVSSILFSNENSVVTAERVWVTNPADITSVLFSAKKSTMNTARMCITIGTAQAVAYISADSKSFSNQNFIDHQGFKTNVCQEAGRRLVYEGAGCFETGSNECTFSCQAFADQASCQA